MSGTGQYRAHPADAIRSSQDGKPEGIFTWVKLPNGNIRLYASRELPDAGWGQREHLKLGVVWHLDANMANLLVVDRPTPAEALTFVLEKWAREDAAEAEARAKLEGPAQLPWSKPDAKPIEDIRQIGR